MFNTVRCRLFVRAQSNKRLKKRGVSKGPLWCPATGWAQPLFAVRGLPWCSPWLLGRGLLRLAGCFCPQQQSSPRHLRLELAEERAGMLLRTPAWPWSSTKVLERWVGSFSSVCSHRVGLWLGPSRCWLLLMASGFLKVPVCKEKWCYIEMHWSASVEEKVLERNGPQACNWL